MELVVPAAAACEYVHTIFMLYVFCSNSDLDLFLLKTRSSDAGHALTVVHVVLVTFVAIYAGRGTIPFDRSVGARVLHSSALLPLAGEDDLGVCGSAACPASSVDVGVFSIPAFEESPFFCIGCARSGRAVRTIEFPSHGLGDNCVKGNVVVRACILARAAACAAVAKHSQIGASSSFAEPPLGSVGCALARLAVRTVNRPAHRLSNDSIESDVVVAADGRRLATFSIAAVFVEKLERLFDPVLARLGRLALILKLSPRFAVFAESAFAF